MTRAEWRTFVESTAISDLAGQAALEVFGDPDPGRGADADRKSARRAAECLNPADPDAEMDRLGRCALGLARDNRAAIARFAATLEANGDRLGEGEVRVALDAATSGGPTPKFGGASRHISHEDFMDQLREATATLRVGRPESQGRSS